jgi:hypothetical protein
VHTDGAQVVRRHVADRGIAEDALAIQHTTIEQALQEAGVIGAGGRQPGATGFHGHGLAHVDQAHGNAAIRVFLKWLGNAVVLVRRHHKAGVHHAQRPQDVVLQKSPSVWPLTASTSAPSRSVARLYSHTVPGSNIRATRPVLGKLAVGALA